MKRVCLSHDNLHEVARLTGGRRWGGGLIVPLPGGGERFVAVGEKVLVGTPKKETAMSKNDGKVTLNVTVDQAGLLAEAISAHRRTLLWALDSLHATEQEKEVARQALVQCNLLLAVFSRVTA